MTCSIPASGNSSIPSSFCLFLPLGCLSLSLSDRFVLTLFCLVFFFDFIGVVSESADQVAQEARG